MTTKKQLTLPTAEEIQMVLGIGVKNSKAIAKWIKDRQRFLTEQLKGEILNDIDRKLEGPPADEYEKGYDAGKEDSCDVIESIFKKYLND